MAEMDLTLVIKSVLSPQAKAAMAQLQTSNTGMIRGTNALATSANKASKAVEGIGRQGKFSRDVLEAFVLYRGFVVLQEGAMAATRALVELEHEVAIVQTQLNEMGKDFQPLIKQRVIDTAQKTGLAFAELAKAEFEIVSANIAVADSFAILELSAKAAAAGGLDNVELAFNAALSQVNAFGMGVDQFDEVFDKQFNLVKRGIFTYEQFATIVGSVSEAFASMGQDVETANAALAAISQVFTGAQIERGATGLRNAVLAISEAPEKFEELGIQVTDAEGNFRNFIDIGRDLKVVLDGMSEAARAATIKSIFPDERERRGINAFLGQLDEAEQFYIEQKFAAGDLDDAFQTVNETLLDQSKILMNDVIPAFDPFLDVISGLVGGFNEMNDIMPGFTKGLINAALAVAAIQATMAFGPGAVGGLGGMLARNRVFSGSRVPQTTMVPGMEGGFTPVTATSFRFNRRAALISGAAGGAMGMGAESFLGAAGMGAAAGSIGGIGGAGIGAAIGLIAHGLGVAMQKEGDNPAKSFAVSFSDELEKRSGDIAGALTAALAESGRGKNITGVSAFDELVASGRILGETETIAINSDVAFRGKDADLMRKIFGEGGEVTIDGKVVQTLEELNRAIAGSGQISVEARRAIALEGLPTEAVSAGLAARETVMGQEVQIRAEARRMGENEDEVFADAVAVAVRDALIESSAGNDALALFVSDFLGAVDFEPTAEQIAGFEAAVAGGSSAMADYVKGLEESLAPISAFKVAATEFKALVEGDAGLAADMLRGLGDEAESLADVMGRVNDLMEGFAKLQQLQQLTMTQTQTVAVNQKFDASGNLVSETETPISAKQASMLRAAGIDVETRSREMSFLEMILGEGGAEEVAAMFQSDMESQIRELFNLSGDAEITPQMVFDFLMGEGGEKPELQLGATGLADALFEAADLVRRGFLDGLGFSADNLEMFGEELQALNKLVRQRAILEEFRLMAEFAGVGTEGIEGAMAILREQMLLGGQSFFELLSDPEKLAELIANMEFGDFNVDQSTQNNFVIRVSGDVSPSQIAALQDSLTDWQNNQTREATAR